MQGKKRRFRAPSPATALSVVALFVSLGGVSYAAATIGSSQIKNNSVASKDIKNKTISTKDISSKARKALKGAKGPAGAAGKVGPAGPAGRSALSSLSSGERIYGTYGLEGVGPNLWTGVTFPIPAPTPVDSLHVVIANNDTVTGDGCTGTAENPVSSPGYVCLYTNISVGTNSGYGFGARCSCGSSVATGDGSRYGFTVQANSAGSTPIHANGVGVYTAP